MNRKQFYQWMDDPSSLDANSLPDLQQLAIDYPYFQTARMLYLFNLKKLQDYRSDQELRRVAAYSADRKRLREWLGILENFEDKPGIRAKKTETELHSFEQIKVDDHLRILEEKIKASLNEIELNKSRLRELIEEKKAIVGDTGHPAQDSPEYDKKSSLRPLPKDKLLEEFLLQKQNQPENRISFYSPEESARRSIEENEGVLSETLARLIAAQGKKDKAIKIYQQLMLKNPQKSSYFAAQIEKLKNQP